MRLHIQPLTPDLLPAIVPASAVGFVENLSYHEIQTFPEKNYGYLDLPTMEAEKLKKKLNGTILKGKKIKIEEAKPRKRRHEDEEADVPAIPSVEPTIESTSRKHKKAKNKPGTTRGYAVSSDRSIKRGWTEVKNDKIPRSKEVKSKRTASRYVEKEELLFQTKVPLNRKDLVKEDNKKNGKKRSSSGDVVHEFEKTVAQPSFLRSNLATGANPTKEYVDGKGWVDENGNIVEGEPAQAARRTRQTRSSFAKDEEPSDGSGSGSEDGSTPRAMSKHSESAARHSRSDDDATSSSGSSDLESETDSQGSNASSSQASSGADQRRSSPNPNASIHPLEALFKKPVKPASQDIAKPSLEIQTSFSFFNPDGDDLEEEAVPGTPLASQDMRSRGHRSAAPTPDTAHPSRYSSYSSYLGEEDDEEDEDEEEDGDDDEDEQEKAEGKTIGNQSSLATPSKSSQLQLPTEQSAFEKQFWENRGELGRGWKRRRREVQKEKRQRENRTNKRSW